LTAHTAGYLNPYVSVGTWSGRMEGWMRLDLKRVTEAVIEAETFSDDELILLEKIAPRGDRDVDVSEDIREVRGFGWEQGMDNPKQAGRNEIPAILIQRRKSGTQRKALIQTYERHIPRGNGGSAINSQRTR
jgi:hypothetical protein